MPNRYTRWRIIYWKGNINSGEHTLPACSRRQLADDIFAKRNFELQDELFGRLPKRTGWQPVLPRHSHQHEVRVDFLGHLRFKSRLQSQ
jgi:hypothetical protein